ncbi:transmembrane sensor [Sphingopyxis sp. OAS728]|uniref:FecR family protein n=1 Tax=Sphingopyxis sp. OAS728 TaxID=2663823 RepID=UPI001789F0D1|nr:FecR domain-containing protein [Sphingopyxis sp. OAS728]MBE1529758.1 transmembrane sensor [Sphingopyxis sp. OAS728]
MTRQQREADDWVGLMHGPDADTHREAFEAWRREPGNAAAYARSAEAYAVGSSMSPARVEAMARTKARKRAKSQWGLATAAALVLVAGSALYMQSLHDETRTAQSPNASEERQLADGTKVILTDGAKIETQFTTGRRVVILTSGSARFEVAHDASRPFTVIAGRSETTALGTVFEVDLRNGPPRVRLVSGRVEVRSSGGGAALRLEPGQSAEVPAEGPKVVGMMVSPVATSLLAADNLPLGSVLESANKVNAKPVRLADPALATLPVSGRFDLADSGALARKLAAAFGLAVDDRTDEIILAAK